MTYHSDHADDLVGRRLGAYRIERMLGRGGMAEVYRAHDSLLNRDVAIKVLHAHLSESEEYVQRFRDEARRIAALSHPHIVPIYHYGEEQGYLYLVMPVLQRSLASVLRQGERPDIAAVIRIGAQIASALACAHTMGIVHRDVKPGNILLDEMGNALLADFGIARDLAMLRQHATCAHDAEHIVITGTPRYMAPEQLRGDPIDQRADIYALGVVIYCLLTGVTPFDTRDTATPLSLLFQQATTTPDPPSAYNARVPSTLDRVVLRALASDPAWRFPDATSFGRALHNSLPRTPIIDLADMPELLAGEREDLGASDVRDGAGKRNERLPRIAAGESVAADSMDESADESMGNTGDETTILPMFPLRRPVPSAATQPVTTFVSAPGYPAGQAGTSTTLSTLLFPQTLRQAQRRGNSAPRRLKKAAALVAMLIVMAGGLFFAGHDLTSQHTDGNAASRGVAGAAMMKVQLPSDAPNHSSTTTPPHGTQPTQPSAPPPPSHGQQGQQGHGHDHGHGHHHAHGDGKHGGD